MPQVIGIRREDKSEWEKRAPLTPRHVTMLEKQGIRVMVQPSPIRVFSNQDYEKAGAAVQEDLSSCDAILAIKEVPVSYLVPHMTYAFFAHVIKGQPYNMPKLQAILDKGCTLVDYEKIMDGQGRRLIFFGRFAGLAGMIDTLWALGRKLKEDSGIDNPFTAIQPTHRYKNLEDAKRSVSKVAEKIRKGGIPAGLAPLVIGVAGYGNVSQGAQEILSLLPVEEIAPKKLLESDLPPSRDRIYKVVFKEEDTVEPRNPSGRFELKDYYANPERYRGVFERYLDRLTVLVNAIYWEERYPRLVTLESLAKLYASVPSPRLKAIGDLSCDIHGAVECTVKATQPDNPVYVFEPNAGKERDGVCGAGPVLLAVDNLPCELPEDASELFGDALLGFVPALVKCGESPSFEGAGLPPELVRAAIVWHGKLRPDYAYLQTHLSRLKGGHP